MSNAIRSVFGIQILKKRHKILRELDKQVTTPTLHGYQVWQSSFLIMDYLIQNPLDDNLKVMDIGCGWGLLGIYCAKHFAADVVLIDADASVFPYANCHAELNCVNPRLLHSSFRDLKPADFIGQDIMLGADICFWPELSTQLRNLIVMGIEAGLKRIILADPGRETFLQLSNFFRHNFNAKLYSREIPGRKKVKGYLLDINLQQSVRTPEWILNPLDEAV